MKLSSGLVGVTLAASFAVASALPLGAAPFSVAQPATAQTDLTLVQYEQTAKPLPKTTGSIRPSFSRQHVDWCKAHYQTYHVADNTYAPPRGVRKQCVSPYQ